MSRRTANLILSLFDGYVYFIALLALACGGIVVGFVCPWGAPILAPACLLFGWIGGAVNMFNAMVNGTVAIPRHEYDPTESA